MNQVPWSAADEHLTRRMIWFDWFVFWASLLAALVVTCFGHLGPAGIILFWCVVDGFLLGRDRAKLTSMLQNKPRSAVNLTTWMRLRPWQDEMMCACGAAVHMSKAKWCPNSEDTGGGRFSIVCPCGVGYYRLKG